MVKIKICGLMREEDAAAVNEYRPDFAGFILAPSRRRVSFAQAARLSALLRPEICPVGVFVNENPDEILRYVDAGIIRAVQLHGQETPQDAAALRARLDAADLRIRPDDTDLQARLNAADRGRILLIKAIRMESEADLRPWLSSAADCLLLDAGSGGTGTQFDHSLLARCGKIEKPWFLAGGMTPENAAGAVRALAPWGVDVSSGVETDGKKDAEKIRCFIEVLRN